MDKSVFHKIELALINMGETIQTYKGEYFLGGLFLGLNSPSIAWAILGLVVAMPTVLLLKNKEWLQHLNEEPVEHVLLFGLLLMCSDIYVCHCISRAMGLSWP